MNPRLVLLVHVPTPHATAVSGALERTANVRAVAVSEPGDILTLAHSGDVRLVVFGPDVVWPGVRRIVDELRADPVTMGIGSLVIAAPDALGGVEAALTAGVDDVLVEPVPSALVCVRVMAQLESRRLRARHAEQSAELERLRAAEREGSAGVVRMLVELMERRTPGAAARAQRMSDLAARIGSRFEVPAELMYDLDIAARLCDLGKLTVTVPTRLPHDAPAHETWAHAPVAADCMARYPGLAHAAEVVQSVGENWDGTGSPSNFLQGQIPLRSRILRAVYDFFTLLDSSSLSDAESVLGHLMERAGTLYDPMVVVELQAVLDDLSGAGLKSDRRLVPIQELEPGMVLAEDLYADSGVKLLARGTSLSPAALEFLMRRHRIAPIPHAAVRREAA